MKKYKVHLVPHMHWDREWYFTTEESRILLVNNMEEIMTRLERDPDYKYYVLDGQTAILEDYFAVKPENRDRVKALVQAGKLIVGPWYSQTDSMVVNGESIARNLMYGIKDSKTLGDYMKIGYVPDSFGQSEQLPQIFNGFGIDKAMFWRGCSERHGTNKTEFYWESLDGSKVLSQILPLGYAIGKYLPNDQAGLKERLDTYLKVLEAGATGQSLILPNGHDQMPIQKDIFQVMDTLNAMYPDHDFFMSNFEAVYHDIEKQADQLDTISGEFVDGKYMRVHRSISSTRMDIKDIHAKLEYRITNVLEPLASMAAALGFEYQHGLIELIWKLIMKNHAHDSIGCCCSDPVHREIMERFVLASDKVESLITFYKRMIADHAPQKEGADLLTVYHLVAKEEDRVVKALVRIRSNDFTLRDAEGETVPFEVVDKHEIDPGLIDRQIVHYGVYDPFVEFAIQFKATDLPAMGYKVYYIEKKEGDAVLVPAVQAGILENEYYRLSVNPNGTINLYDKELEKTFENLLVMEEGSDDGDEYDYSPLPPDQEWVLTNQACQAQISMEKQGLVQTAKISYRMKLPSDLRARKLKQLDSFTDFEIEVKLTKGLKRVDVKVSIDNQVKDHRLRFLLPTTYAADFSVADQQFGSIERPVVDDAMEVWKEEKWKEMPVSVFSMMSMVGLHKQEEGFAVLTHGLREYEVVGETYDTLAITLMRGVGVLGKENLYTRPGRPSGIKMLTPDSQMIGKQTYDLALFTHKNASVEGKVFQAAKRYTTGLDVYNKIPFDAMKLNKKDLQTPVSFGLFELTGEAVLSAVKESENGKALVVRIFNPYRDRNVSASLRFGKAVEAAMLANMNEAVQANVPVEEDIIHIREIKPCQAKTIMVKLK